MPSKEEALAAYDKIVGFDFSEVSVDGDWQKARRRGRNRQEPDRSGKLGWKWSIVTDRCGIRLAGPSTRPTGTTRLLPPTLEVAGTRGLLAEVETIWLDKGYD